jgi:SAM-dependent methyltransferase
MEKGAYPDDDGCQAEEGNAGHAAPAGRGKTREATSQAMIAPFLQALLRRYAESEAEAIVPFLVGGRLLDLGAGEGYVTAALWRRTGTWVCAVDIGPYRQVPVPYLIYDGSRLPFENGTFDTTLISLALHHCADPEAVLDEALRVTSLRLIILESVYRNRWERFCLEHLDGWLNRYRHGGEMHLPLAFKRAEEWQQLFDARPVRIIDRLWLGSRWERLVHQPLLFVLEKVDRSESVSGDPSMQSVLSGTETDHARRRL